jgi:hypothetical protein
MQLWHAYLSERLLAVRGLPPRHPALQALANTCERALVTMHKMPRIWLMYLEARCVCVCVCLCLCSMCWLLWSHACECEGCWACVASVCVCVCIHLQQARGRLCHAHHAH